MIAQLYPADSNDKTTHQWQPDPYILLRAGGLSFSVLSTLSLTQTASRLDVLKDRQARYEHDREDLSNLLYAVIGQKQDSPDLCKLLVTTKRDMFNARPLSDLQKSTLDAVMDAVYMQRLMAYYAETEAILHESQAVASLFDTELSEKRRLLQHYLGNRHFQFGLLITQPKLYDQLQTYVKADVTRLNKKERAAEPKLFRYMVRSASKTSPFSRFGPVGLGQYHLGETQLTSTQFALTGQLTFNQEVAAYVIAKIGKRKSLWAYFRPRLNTSIQIVGEMLVFYGKKLVEKSGHLSLEPIRRVGKYDPLLQNLIGLLSETSFDTLKAFMQHALLQWGQVPEEAQRIRKTIEAMIQSDLIILDSPYFSDQPNRLHDLQGYLATLPIAEAHTLADMLTDLQHTLAQCADAPIGDQARLVRHLTKTLQTLIGWDEDKQGEFGYASLLFEDVAIQDLSFTIGHDMHTAFADDLQILLDALLARNHESMGYILIRDVFLQTYGEGATAPSLNDFMVHYLQHIQANGFASAGTDDFMHRQKAFMKALIQLHDDGIEDVKPFMQAYQAENPSPLDSPYSLMLMTQVVAENPDALRAGDFSLVINTIMPGFGRYYSRYAQLFAEQHLAHQIETTLAHYQNQLPAHSEAVDVLSVLDNNSQIHPKFTPRQLVPTDETSSEAPDAQIPTTPLTIRHCAKTNQMLLTDGTTDFYPMYMGFLHNAWLPGLHGILADLSPTGLFIPYLAPADFPFLDDEVILQGDEVQHWRRMRVGKLIFQREAWHVNADYIRQLLSHPTLYENFCAFREWAKKHQLPRYAFLRSGTLSVLLNEANDGLSSHMTRHKPLFIDFDNPLTIAQVLDQIGKFSQPDRVVLRFQEMLPQPPDFCFGVGDDPYVFELQLQYSRRMQS